MAKWGARGSAQYRKTNRAYQHEYRRLYPDRHREIVQRYHERNRERVRALDLLRRQRAKQIIIDAKRVPCKDCRKCYPPYVMDFDHVRGTKIANIASGRFHSAIRGLLKEIKKCDVVCANCHREREHKRRQEVA